MCLIIHKPKQIEVPIALVENAFDRNNDGWGMMYHSDDGVITLKGMLITELKTHLEAFAHLEYYLHLRYRTHGNVCIENNHPFVLGNSGVAMMHNGTLNINVPLGSDYSDTAYFAESITPTVEKNPDIIFTKEFESLVNSYAGGDRLIFLHPNGNSVRLGTGKWTPHKGLSLSNTYAWDYYYDTPYKNVRGTTYDSNFDDPRGFRPSYSSSRNSTTLTSNYFDFYGSEDNDEQFEADDNQQYSLQQLQAMDKVTLENLIWEDPRVAIDAIYASRSNYVRK